MQLQKSIWACFRFPNLALDVFDWPENTPSAVEESKANQRIISHCNKLAHEAGIHAGMSVPTAYSLCEQLIIQPRSIRAEEKQLRELALWAYQFSSTITLKFPNCLLLELGSSLALFKGWQAMLEHIESKLNGLKISAKFSIANTPAAAFLYSQASIYAKPDTEELAASLPFIKIQHLDVDNSICEALNGMGIETLSQLAALPQAGLTKRFGVNFTSYLNKLTGEKPDPQPAFNIPLHFQDDFDFITEVEHLQGIQFALKRMFVKMEHYLRARQKQVQNYQITLLHRKQQKTVINVQFASRLLKADDLFKMAQLKLETITTEQPIIGLILSANRFLAQQEKAKDLFGEQQAQGEKSALLDKLQMRLGEQHCHGLSATADHRPEKAWRHVAPEQAQVYSHAKQRPLWLLAQPQALLERNGKPVYFGPLQMLNGPERIETGWWDNQPINRDYFIVKHHKGPVYWIYFERELKKWYLHGLFA